jgi:hypothetical protein
MLAGSVAGEQLVSSDETSVARFFLSNSFFPLSGKLLGKKNLQQSRGGNFSNNTLPSGSGILIEASERTNIFFAGFEKDAFLHSKSTSNGTTTHGYVEVFSSGSSGVFHLGRGGGLASKGLFETTGSRHEDITLSGTVTGNGSTTISNIASVTATGTVQAEHLRSTDDAQIDDDLTVSGDINANGNIVGDNSTNLTNMKSGSFSYLKTTADIDLGGQIRGTSSTHTFIGNTNGGYIDLKSNSTNYGVLIRQNDGTNWGHLDASSTYLQIGYKSTSDGIFIDDADEVGIGDNTPSYKLDVTGTIRATADVIAYSDRRVKENIITIGNPLEKIKELRGVTYNRIDIDDKSKK